MIEWWMSFPDWFRFVGCAASVVLLVAAFAAFVSSFEVSSMHTETRKKHGRLFLAALGTIPVALVFWPGILGLVLISVVVYMTRMAVNG